MIFVKVYNNNKDLDEIPSSYTIIKVDGKFGKEIKRDHALIDIYPGMKLFKNPSEEYIHEYRNKLIVTYKRVIDTIVCTDQMDDTSSSTVLVASKDSIVKAKFDYLETIKEVIEYAYHIKVKEFTNHISPADILHARMSTNSVNRLYEEVVHPRVK